MNRQNYSAEDADGTKTVLEILRERNVFLPADCGGRGTCGKCRVQFQTGAPEPTEEERKKLSAEQLQRGVRLACRTRPEGAFALSYELSEEDIAAEGLSAGSDGKSIDAGGLERAVAIDIGTTTLAAALVQKDSGQVIRTAACVNHQRAFGADVISRIQASNDGHGEELQRLIREDLRKLCAELGADPEGTPLVIAGNTTMQHLLQGLSCRTLGVAPFTPVDMSLHQSENMVFLPGISTYVGADIVAGIVATGMDRSEEICMLIDLGTNGEMAIGNREQILVASTAAGPAFEGGNISCGMAGVPGAISRVTIENGTVRCETIGNSEPVGLCGTGVLEVMFELLKEEIVDETGLLDDAYVDEGFSLAEGIRFTDRDIREVQLAKAAIRAGAETLIRECGTTYEEIRHLYLAGGFGQKIDLKKAAGIGILPAELIDRTEASGNTSLKGAVMAVREEARERFRHAAAISREVNLSGNAAFNELYMECMFFEP